MKLLFLRVLCVLCGSIFRYLCVSPILDEEEFMISALGGDELQDILLGVRWLQTKRLVADFPAGVLTLG
ncbi:MAG: hypothetical protein V7L01_09600 [Nostoc sp.]|uniref:hypothetical protein n=1 Tax=Nostoc sp. TaxID=1180 RepID=UPI002FF8BE0F